MPHFTHLKFKLVKLTTSTELTNKFTKFDLPTYIERIFASLKIISFKNEMILRIQGIIDTGAVFSLLPKEILKEFPNISTQSYDLKGIVDKPDCKLESELALIPIQLIDDYGNFSPIIKVLCAFSENGKIPILIGMKGILADYSYQYDKKSETFTISFNELD